MTREEAIKGFEDMKKGLYPFYPDEYFDMAIKALEQEPTTKNDLGVDCISRADAIRVASGYCHPSNVAKELAKLPSVTPQEPVLDKIRADVQNGTHHFLDGESIIEIKEVLQIIDKYKEESVAEDGNDD